MVNSGKITLDLIEYLNQQDRNRSIVIPNYYYRKYEMDIFHLSRNEYITEYEIKISVADFKKDFKKKRSKKEFTRKGRQIVDKFKHDTIAAGEYDSNKFYFVVPKDLITIKDIPDYAGLIYYDEGKELKKRFSIIKKPKFIHKNKIECGEYRKIAIKLSYRENTVRQKNFILSQK